MVARGGQTLVRRGGAFDVPFRQQRPDRRQRGGQHAGQPLRRFRQQGGRGGAPQRRRSADGRTAFLVRLSRRVPVGSAARPHRRRRVEGPHGRRIARASGLEGARIREQPLCRRESHAALRPLRIGALRRRTVVRHARPHLQPHAAGLRAVVRERDDPRAGGHDLPHRRHGALHAAGGAGERTAGKNALRPAKSPAEITAAGIFD